MSKQNPHLGQVTINAIVYKQLPDGIFSPEAVWHDSFAITFNADTPEQCIEELKVVLQKIRELKEKNV